MYLSIASHLSRDLLHRVLTTPDLLKPALPVAPSFPLFTLTCHG